MVAVTPARVAVIAGGCSDDAVRFLIVGESHEAVVGAANLKRTGLLQIFRLEQHMRADNSVERLATNEGCRPDDAGEAAARLFDSFGHHRANGRHRSV